jgi:hypothetical protein
MASVDGRSQHDVSLAQVAMDDTIPRLVALLGGPSAESSQTLAPKYHKCVIIPPVKGYDVLCYKEFFR